MGARLGGNNDEPIAEINVVPLVDIILVVLIIFMVTAPMIMKPSIDVKLPKAASGKETAPTKLNVAVTKDGAIQLNGQKITLDALQAEAEKLREQNPEIQAIISADQSVPHGEVIAVIDKVKLAGVTKFAISVEKP
jgi:biopolymer transport protein ExbD